MDTTVNEIVELYFEGHELKEILENYKEGQKRYQRNYVKYMADKMFRNWKRSD